jgi:hypothetical protein
MNLTREQIEQLESNGSPMPVQFTGLWKGNYFYKGFRWCWPTNRLGAARRCTLTEEGLVPRGD